MSLTLANEPMRARGVAWALWAAAVFGASAPCAKSLLGHLDPLSFAGLLYLGSGVGLTLFRGMRRWVGRGPTSDHALEGKQWGWLTGSVFSGGILAPALLMIGLQQTSAATGSLLLNFEGVLTAVLAWVLFREIFRMRVFLGLLAMVIGGVVLAWTPGLSIGWSSGSVAIVAACLGWGFDNNCTRRIAQADPIQIVEIKGWVAGVVNLIIGYLWAGRGSDPEYLLPALLLGFFSYGLSMLFLVRALRELGAARTGAYFSIAPFVGAGLSILLLHEPVSLTFWIAGGCMALGVWLTA